MVEGTVQLRTDKVVYSQIGKYVESSDFTDSLKSDCKGCKWN